MPRRWSFFPHMALWSQGKSSPKLVYKSLKILLIWNLFPRLMSGYLKIVHPSGGWSMEASISSESQAFGSSGYRARRRSLRCSEEDASTDDV